MSVSEDQENNNAISSENTTQMTTHVKDEKKDVILASSIRKQIEFYFSDSNLPRDKFLSQKISESKDGWIELSLMASFNRLKRLDADVMTLASALRNQSTLLEVSEDGQRVRRTTPLPVLDEHLKKEMNSRTVYVKGFSKEETTNFEDIERVCYSLFNGGDMIKSIRMRRIPSTKLFKGSVFIEFSTEEEADRVSKLLPPPRLANGQELLVMMKQDYLEKKQRERENRRTTKETKKQHSSQRDSHKETIEKKIANQEYPKGCLIHFDKVTSETSREDLKAYFSKANVTVSYVDFSRGDTSGYLRLAQGDATKAIDYVQTSQETLNNVLPELRVLEGEEESSYWKTIYGLILEKRTNKKISHHHHHRKRQNEEMSSSVALNSNGTTIETESSLPIKKFKADEEISIKDTPSN